MSVLETRKAVKNISQKKRYECEHCNVVCSSVYGLREHLRKHTGFRPFVCKQCNRPFKRMMGLRKHEQFIHGAPGLKQFNCPDCKVVSKSLGNAIRHCLVVHKNLRRFICSFCLAKYSQSQELKTHISSKHNVIIDNINSQEKRSICEVYVLPPFDPKDRTEDLKAKLKEIVKGEEEKLKGLETLISSIKNNADVEQVKAVPSNQTTIKLLSRDNSEIEIQINDKENNDECPADQNIEHDIAETNSSEVLKESCPETWISFVLERPSIIYNEICYEDCIPVEIDSNIEEIHFRDSEINEDCTTIICVENNTYWKCDVCEKSFSEERKLSRHRKIHCDEKSYKCNKCEKMFQEHHNLVIHYRTHTGERPYICAICNKEIRYHKDYVDHLVSHSGEKRFTCNICDKKFLRKRDCNRHMLSHNKGSRFNCEMCGKGFSRRYLMLRHILKQHNSDIDGNQQAITKQVYECDVCRKNYKTLQGFIHHKTKHTGLTEHQCHICSKSFLSATRLEAHLRNHIPRVKNVTCSECQRKFSSQDTLKIHMGRFHKHD